MGSKEVKEKEQRRREGMGERLSEGGTYRGKGAKTKEEEVKPSGGLGQGDHRGGGTEANGNKRGRGRGIRGANRGVREGVGRGQAGRGDGQRQKTSDEGRDTKENMGEDSKVGEELKPVTSDPKRTGRGVKVGRGGRKIATRDERNRESEPLNQRDYLQLLRFLRIKLPEGVLTKEVVRLANTEKSIQEAQALLPELENFLLHFRAVPRLGCREVKHSLALMRDDQVLQITRLIFFDQEHNKDQQRKQWEENWSKTGRGFRLRERYRGATAISTPVMYSTAVTRSWKMLEAGTDAPILTPGTRVKLADIVDREYSDESKLWEENRRTPGTRFGMFSQNKNDELEMLKFFHELKELKGTVTYTKGNKVEYGFLTGRLDFLAQIQTAIGKTSRSVSKPPERLVIECKSTTGDMEGERKLFTKVPRSVHAKINPVHEYSFQVQTYMFILNTEARVKKVPQMNRAAMVVRHYHEGGSPPIDVHWSYLEMIPAVQAEIQDLQALCRERVLAQYLALLNLIFEKETHKTQPNKHNMPLKCTIL